MAARIREILQESDDFSQDGTIGLDRLVNILCSMPSSSLSQEASLALITGSGAGRVRIDEFVDYVFPDSSPVPVPTPVAGKRVAVYSGAFDPITSSHLTCASQILSCDQADEVWLLPMNSRPGRTKREAGALDRYCMCQIAVNTGMSPKLPVKVSDFDCLNEGYEYTYDLLKALSARYPDRSFTFVIGSDWLTGDVDIRRWTSSNPNWCEGDSEDQREIVTGHQLLAEFDILVIPRPGHRIKPTADDRTGLNQFGSRLSWLSVPGQFNLIEGNLSSSEIRKRAQVAWTARTGMSGVDGSFPALYELEGLVPMGVVSYIWRKRLYMPAHDGLLDPQRRAASQAELTA